MKFLFYSIFIILILNCSPNGNMHTNWSGSYECSNINQKKKVKTIRKGFYETKWTLNLDSLGNGLLKFTQPHWNNTYKVCSLNNSDTISIILKESPIEKLPDPIVFSGISTSKVIFKLYYKNDTLLTLWNQLILKQSDHKFKNGLCFVKKNGC